MLYSRRKTGYSHYRQEVSALLLRGLAAARQGRGGGVLRALEGRLKRRKGETGTGAVEVITIYK
jgi:hypothetical protein